MLECVDRALEGLENGLDLEDFEGVRSTGEQLGYHRPVEFVALVLQLVDLDPRLADGLVVVDAGEAPHRFVGQLGAGLQNLDLGRHPGRKGLRAVEDDVVAGLVDEIDAVIENRGEGVEILAIEGEDEGLVDLVEYDVTGVVRILLDFVQLLIQIDPALVVGADDFGKDLR